MISGQLALVTAALFTGAAIYVSAVEHPARMALETAPCSPNGSRPISAALPCRRASPLIGFLLGAWAFWETQNWLWLAGGLTLLAGWPYTLLVILPTNNRLLATPIEAANAETRALIAQMGARCTPCAPLSASPAHCFSCWPRSQAERPIFRQLKRHWCVGLMLVAPVQRWRCS